MAAEGGRRLRSDARRRGTRDGGRDRAGRRRAGAQARDQLADNPVPARRSAVVLHVEAASPSHEPAAPVIDGLADDISGLLGVLYYARSISELADDIRTAAPRSPWRRLGGAVHRGRGGDRGMPGRCRDRSAVRTPATPRSARSSCHGGDRWRHRGGACRPARGAELRGGSVPTGCGPTGCAPTGCAPTGSIPACPIPADRSAGTRGARCRRTGTRGARSGCRRSGARGARSGSTCVTGSPRILRRRCG
jgi:hypothetical protein